MFKFFYFFIFLFLASHTSANCDFSTAEFLNRLTQPEEIKNITIEVNNNKKYLKNFYKIILSSKNETIPTNLRKNFPGILHLNYDFGSCQYKVRLRQHGDYTDHIGFIDGKPLASLDVKMRTGNVVNAIKFKLLIPRTRNDLEEVLGTIILRELGFIVPETFKVNTKINGVNSIMLFQEGSRKEMLERNKRREGPIFEGDESLLFGESRNYLDNISLARLINKNWLIKGQQSALISLRSMQKLQNAYVTSGDNKNLLGNYLQPNTLNKNKFNDYHFFLMALNGYHAFFPHNRKFYFNTFLDEFEPIYYDGMLKIHKNYSGSIGYEDFSTGKVSSYSFAKDYKIPNFERINSDNFQSKIISEFRKRSLLPKFKSDTYVKSKLMIFRSNIIKMKKKIKSEVHSKNYVKLISKDNEKYLKRVDQLGIEQTHVSDIKIIDDRVQFTIVDNKDVDVIGNYSDLANLLSRLSYKDKRFIYLPDSQHHRHLRNYIDKTIKISNGEVLKSEGVKIQVDYSKKKINIYQSLSSDWVLFRGVDLNSWSIIFNGSKKVVDSNYNQQRFNLFGLTGCLNFYDAKFNETKIVVKNGGCEDSLNIVNSAGTIEFIDIINAYSDAVDFDFSNLDVLNLDVNNASNDCLDVSGGNYFLDKVFMSNCGDKGVSVGENSVLNANEITVFNSNIGVSSKDYSRTSIENFNSKSKYCYQTYQKKQEFGGAFLKIVSMSCIGKNIVDDKSKVIIGNN